jgi:hypothetical protein
MVEWARGEGGVWRQGLAQFTPRAGGARGWAGQEQHWRCLHSRKAYAGRNLQLGWQHLHFTHGAAVVGRAACRTRPLRQVRTHAPGLPGRPKA